MLWLPNYAFRKPFAVSNASANYQTNILVGESAGALGEEVDLDGKCQTDFDDLRFTGANGVTLLDYWIESITGTTPNQLATIWVENDSTPSTIGAMYYGNPNATAVSNGANTFIIFDNFERGNDGDTIGGSWTEEVAHVHISTDRAYGGTRCAKIVTSASVLPAASIPVTSGAAISIRFRYYRTSTAPYFLFPHGDGSTVAYPSIAVTGQDVKYYTTSWQDTGDDVNADAWNLIEYNQFDWTANTFDIWVNGVLAQDNAAEYVGAYYINQFKMWSGTGTVGQDNYIDDFLVCKWAAIKQTFTFGSEEKAFQPWAIIM